MASMREKLELVRNLENYLTMDAILCRHVGQPYPNETSAISEFYI